MNFIDDDQGAVFEVDEFRQVVLIVFDLVPLPDLVISQFNGRNLQLWYAAGVDNLPFFVRFFDDVLDCIRGFTATGDGG